MLEIMFGHRTFTRGRGFSLVELVVVVTIIGIIASIGVSRVSSSAGGAEVAVFHQNWSEMTNAVDFYNAEHQRFPSSDEIVHQLTKTTDLEGKLFANQPKPTAGIIFGPYLRRIPVVPLGPHQGENGIAADNRDGIGWLYFESQGLIVPNILSDDNRLSQEALNQLGKSRQGIQNWAEAAGIL